MLQLSSFKHRSDRPLNYTLMNKLYKYHMKCRFNNSQLHKHSIFYPQYYKIDPHHNYLHSPHLLLIHYHRRLNNRQNWHFDTTDNWMDKQNIRSFLSKIQLSIMNIKKQYKLNNQMYKQHITYFLICNFKHTKYIHLLCM